MDPVSEAIKMFDVGNILLAGAAVISLVIVYVGIDKVKELFGGEAHVEDAPLYCRPKEPDGYDEGFYGLHTEPDDYEDYEFNCDAETEEEFFEKYAEHQAERGLALDRDGEWRPADEVVASWEAFYQECDNDYDYERSPEYEGLSYEELKEVYKEKTGREWKDD